jgi:hypothetical protein
MTPSRMSIDYFTLYWHRKMSRRIRKIFKKDDKIKRAIRKINEDYKVYDENWEFID